MRVTMERFPYATQSPFSKFLKIPKTFQFPFKNKYFRSSSHRMSEKDKLESRGRSVSSSQATLYGSLKEGESSKSIDVGIQRPKKFQPSQVSFNLDKYTEKPLSEIYLDPRPRIKNIVKELEEEHQWSWPPQPPKDFEKARLKKRKKCPLLYNKECLDFSTILSLIIGPWELLVALGFLILPKTFIPAMRESSEFCILFVAIFLIEGFYHTYAAILGLGLRSMRPYMIGFSFPSWPFEFVLPLLGIFVVFISFYTTQRWRLLREMTSHLKGYNYRWYSKSHWDHYQDFMHCCGIDNYTDWKYHGPLLEGDNGQISSVPNSCCIEEDCWKNATESNVHAWGCLEVTILGTNTIFVSAAACMLIALILSVIGYRSMREAEDFVGDPCHSLLFEGNAGNTLRHSNRAVRREELFSLLTYYSVLLGEELGFTEEVNAVKDHIGLEKEEPEVTLLEVKSDPPKDMGDTLAIIPIPLLLSEENSPTGGKSLDFLFENDTAPGSKIDFAEVQKTEEPEKPEEKSEEPENPEEKSEEPEEIPEKTEEPEKPEEPKKPVEKSEEPEETPETEVLLPKQPSLMLSPSAMEFAIPPETENPNSPNPEKAYFMLDPSESVINLIPEIPSEMTRVDVLDPSVQSDPRASAVQSVSLQSPVTSDPPSAKDSKADKDDD